jgi:hypothetical protein
MAIDPRISLGVQQLQLNDPLTQYGQTQNILAAQSQRQAAGTQNELAQAQLGQARMSMREVQEAQEFITQIMAEAKKNGAPTDDPMNAAMQMLNHPNPKVREAGKSLFDANQTVLAYQQQAQFMQDQSPEAAAGPTTTFLSSIAPETAFTTPVSRGTQTNALASTASPAPQVNAMAAPQGKTADSIKAEIQSGDRKYGSAPGWAKQRELLVKQFESALDPRRSTFAAITPKDYTQESIAKFNLTGNYADLVQKVDIKNTNLGNVNPADYTPDSVQKFATSGNYADLVLKPAKADTVIANVNPADYTPESLAKFATSKNYGDLVLKPAKVDKSVSNINPDSYTPASVQKFMMSSNYADLVPRDTKETKLIANINPDSYTLESVAKFSTSNNYADLVLKPSKADKAIGNVNPADYTPKSVAKFNVSGNYADLVPKAPVSSATPSAPVAVVGKDGKTIYVSREEAISKGMTPANAMEGLAPKEIQAREAKYPVAKQSVTTVSATMNEIDATVKRLLENEKGLNGITGLVYGNTPALTDAARKAAADLKQLKNLAFVQGLTELRAASATGAAVGNVTNKEGDRFENLKASLETSQSFDDLKASLTRLQSQAIATRDTVKQTFEDTYSYRNNTPAAKGAVDTSNPLLKGK